MATRPTKPAKKPAAKKPAAQKPAAKRPAPRKPAQKPAARKPAAEQPAPAEKPAPRARKPAAAVPPTTLRSAVQPPVAALVAPQPLHTRLVHELAVGPDGEAYSAGEDGRVLAFDARTLAVRREFTGHEGPVNTLALSQDGRTLVTGGDDHTVRVWDAATGVCQTVLRSHDGYVRQVAISGDRIASGSEDDLLKLWSLSEGILLATVAHPEDVMAVALSPDGQRVATASLDNAVRLYDATTGALVRTLYDAGAWVSRLPGMSLFIAAENRTGRGHKQTPTRLRFSADGQTLYSAEKEVLAWDLRSEAVRTAAPDNGWTSNGLALRGDLLAVGSYGLRLVDAATGAVRACLAQGVDQITAMAFDGDALLVGQDKGLVSRWPAALAAGPQPAPQPHAGAINEIRIDAQSRRAAVLDMFNVVSLWDLATGQCTAVLDDLPQANGCAMAFSPDGERLATSRDGEIHVWRTATGERLQALTYVHETSPYLHPSALAFEPGGTLLVGSSLQHLTRWHLDGSGRVDKLEGRTQQVLQLQLSRDGRWALSQGHFGDVPDDYSSSSSRLQLWDLAAMKLHWTKAYPPYSQGKDQPSLTMLALSPDGQTVWASDPRTLAAIGEWSASTGEGRTHALEAGHGHGGLLQDGRLWLSVQTRKGARAASALQLWTAGGAAPTQFAVPRGRAVAGVSGDGEVALLRGDDQVTFWSTAAGASLGHAEVDAPLRHAALSPDGRVAVLGDALGRVWIVGR
jgi:WD40 repeat protein